MKKFFHDFRKWAREDRYYYAAELHGALGGNPRSKWRRWEPFFSISWIWMSIPGQYRNVLCFFKGHVVKDLSCCGPDSGDIHLECRRCGDTLVHEILY